MQKTAMLTIRGKQSYQDQEPEIIELVTEGTLERLENGWCVSYEESDLTGMKGVTTTFRAEPGKIVLDREGELNSQMIFQEGVFHDSLYQMSFGALMITVCANKVRYDLTETGGTIDLTYAIEIENTAAGYIEYHLDIQA